MSTEVVETIKTMEFNEKNGEKDEYRVFTPSDLSKFKEPFMKEISEKHQKLSLIDSISIQITKSGSLPLPLVIIEISLDKGPLQDLIGNGLEKILWELTRDLYDYFSKTHSVLSFSKAVFRNTICSNSAIEVVVSLKQERFEKLLESVNEYCLFQSKLEQEKIGSALIKLASYQPVKFYSDGFSNKQTIIKGYSNTTFVIGTVVPSTLDSSPPLYLITFTSENSTPREFGKNPPVITPRSFPLYDLSDGVGQLLFLDLLNSWNKRVEIELNNLVQHKTSEKNNLIDNISEKSKELEKLFNFGVINERITVNFGLELGSVANPPEDLHELNLKEIYVFDRLEALQTIIGGFAQGKFHPLFSELASTVLKLLKVNESRILSLRDLWKSRVEFLTNKSNEKTNSKMYRLTCFIAFLTGINFLVFLFYPWIISHL